MLRTNILKHDYLAARALCRTTLSRYAGVDPLAWRFSKSAHGKPAINEPAEFRSLQFNLTGASGLIACIVSRAGPVGVDAEDTSRIIDAEGISKHFFSKLEQENLSRLPPDERAKRFFELWVLKEAYLKGCGVGLSHPPNEFTIELDESRNALPLHGWQLKLACPTPHHVGASAIKPESPREIPVNWLDASHFISGSMHQ